MKKIFLLFTLSLFIASFAACSTPAEVKTPEAGKAPLSGAKVSTGEDDGATRAGTID